jgi:hypothetical protein
VTDQIFACPHSALSREDSEAFAIVLPGAELYNVGFPFYLHAAALFKSSLAVQHEVLFSHVFPTGPVPAQTRWRCGLALSPAMPTWDCMMMRMRLKSPLLTKGCKLFLS